MSVVLAIDLGGTHLRAGIGSTDDPSRVQPIGNWPAPQSRAAFGEIIRALVTKHGASHIGVGIPGFAIESTCSWVPNLPDLNGFDIGAQFPGLSIGLGNDAQLALLAEASAGAAVGLADAILLAIGTGIGSAVLASGRIVTGSKGGACSFGWATADMRDNEDASNGWLERQASGRALNRVALSIGLSDGVALVDAARDGSLSALRALAIPMNCLGTALAGAVTLLDPEAIIFAGGVAASIDVLAPLIRPQLLRHVPPHLQKIELRPGKYGPQAGLIGAAFAGAYGKNWRNGNG